MEPSEQHSDSEFKEAGRGKGVGRYRGRKQGRPRGRGRSARGRAQMRERSALGRRPAVRRARGRGRLIAEPNSEDRQVAHENQLQVRDFNK